jgi:hypothetical protein
MDTVPLNTAKVSEFSSSSRLLMLQSLVPVATNLVSSQLEAFTSRLTDALFKISDQTLQPEEAANSFQACQLLKRNQTTFYRLLASQISTMLMKEVGAINTRKRLKDNHDIKDISLVTFEEMENKVLTNNLTKSLEVNSAEKLVELNCRIGLVMKRTPITVSQNPFRPEIFVNAVLQAWMELESTTVTPHLIIRIMQPDLFLNLSSVYQGLNDALAERGIVVDTDAVKREKKRHAPLKSEDLDSRDPYLQNKLRNIFYPQASKERNQSGGVGAVAQDGAGQSGPFNHGCLRALVGRWIR